MLQPNQREILLVNRQIVYNFLKIRDVTPETFEANEELRKAVRGARIKQRQETKIRSRKIKRKIRSRYKEDKINER